MSNNHLKDLYEAYSQVYSSQEITEDKIWEEVENWVNSFLEEGFDLSEYTWEEIYESYIEEQGRSSRGPIDPAVESRWAAIGNTIATGNSQGTRPTPSSRPTNLRGGGRVTENPSVTSTRSRFAGSRDAAFQKAKAIQGSPVVGSRQPAATARPTAPAARPSGGAPAVRPSGGAPAASSPAISAKKVPTPVGQTGDKVKDMGTWAKANPKLAARVNPNGTQIAPKSNNPNSMVNKAASLRASSTAIQKARESAATSPSSIINKKQPQAPTRAGTLTMNSSYDFGNPNQITKDVANLYQSIYEGKKKVDQDADGDNDFADVRIARMIASGVPKEEAIRRVRNKSYNEEVEIAEAAKRTPKKVKGDKDSGAYMAGRSLAGKRISGDEKTGPRYYTLGHSRVDPDAPTQPGAKPENTPKYSKSEKNYARTKHSDTMSGIKKGYLKVGGKKGLPEDFSLWIDELIEEGYDLSDYTWDEMAEIYEETELEKRQAKEAAIAARRARVAELKKQGRVLTSSQRTSERAKARREEQRGEKLERAGDEVIRKIQGKPVTRTEIGGKAPAPKEQAPEATRRLKPGLKRDTLGKAADDILKGLSRHDADVARRAQEVLAKMKNEEYELYDLVLEHLVDEGFADDYELAHTIIEHMSDEWLEEIIEAKKWIQKAIKKPGALSKQLGVPEEENIPLKKLRAAAKKGGKLGKRARLAKTLRKFK